MKLEKAREIIELNIKEAGNKMPPDTLEALKLENECTKRIQHDRIINDDLNPYPLPGETEE